MPSIFAATVLAGAPPSKGAFWRPSQINKASIVMLVETGLVPRAVAGQIAAGMQQVIADVAARERSVPSTISNSKRCWSKLRDPRH